MAKYNVKLSNVDIGVNMMNVANYTVSGNNDGDCVAFDPNTFIDLYGYVSGDRDGSTAAKAYQYNSGLQPDVVKTSTSGYPTVLPYSGNLYWLICNAFATMSSSTLGIGYPVSMVQISMAEVSGAIRCGLHQWLVSSKSQIIFNDMLTASLNIVIRRSRAGSATTYWDGDAWDTTEHVFTIDMKTETSINRYFTFSIQSGQPYVYTIEAYTLIDKIRSMHTYVSFELVNPSAQSYACKIVDSGLPISFAHNMYSGKYFRTDVADVSHTYCANLPMLGTPTGTSFD